MPVSAWSAAEQHELVCSVPNWSLSNVVERFIFVRELRQRANDNCNWQHCSFGMRVCAWPDVERLSVRELRGQLVQSELRNWRLLCVLIESSDAIDWRDVCLCVRLRGWLGAGLWLLYWCEHVCNALISLICCRSVFAGAVEERLQPSELVHSMRERPQHGKHWQHEHRSLRVPAWHDLGRQRLQQLCAQQLQVELRRQRMHAVFEQSADAVDRRYCCLTVRVRARFAVRVRQLLK